MRKSFFKAQIALFVVAIFFISCNSPSEKLENAKADVAKEKGDLKLAKEAYRTEIENYRKETSNKLTENQRMINDIKSRINNTKNEAKAGFAASISEIEEKNKAMQIKLDEYNEEGLERWESFKNEYNHDMDELEASLKGLTEDNVK